MGGSYEHYKQKREAILERHSERSEESRGISLEIATPPSVARNDKKGILR